ncbi:TPA: hypothetical protein ACK0X5_002463 [Staphylococcus aureus]
MVKPFEVNINEIELDNINEKQRKEIEKETNNLNGIDNLFALVIALVLAITFINGLLSNDNFSYMMLLVSLLGIITIIYIRYARSKQKKKLKVLLEQTTLVNQKAPIKIVNYHEKAHTIAMYALLISLIFSLINSILDIMYK